MSLRDEQIDEMRAALPGWTVGIEHTGGGCYWLAFYPPMSEPSDEDPRYGCYYAATDGEASLPTSRDLEPVAIRDGWGYVGRYFWNETDPERSENHPDYEGTRIAEPFIDGEDSYTSSRYWNEYPEHCLTDAAVIEAIRADWERLTKGEK